ncbi:hypothetical protein QJS66_19570 [Kocuria rhizophila]|nr:hypothetical protein QJS66_19570 [Kocuria rhizophila]
MAGLVSVVGFGISVLVESIAAVLVALRLADCATARPTTQGGHPAPGGGDLLLTSAA